MATIADNEETRALGIAGKTVLSVDYVWDKDGKATAEVIVAGDVTLYTVKAKDVQP